MSVNNTSYFLIAFPIWPMLEYEIELILEQSSSSKKIEILACNGNRSYCSANNPGINKPFLKSACLKCHSRLTAGLKILADFKVPYKISFGDNCHPEAQIAKVENYLRGISDVTSVDEAILKELCKFADIDFYESVISTLITDTKNSGFRLTADTLNTFLNCLTDSYKYFWRFKRLIKEEKKSSFFIYNGRISFYSPAMDYCRQKEFNFYTYEYPLYGYSKYVLIASDRVHNQSEVSRLIYEAANISRLGDDKAEHWFSEKMSGNILGREPNFVRNFSDDTTLDLVGNIDILFLTSTEYEFARVGEKMSTMPFSQKDTISFVSKLFPDLFKCVRVHPQYSKVDMDMGRSFLSFHRKNKINVIGSQSSISTYGLIDKARLIITWGSSTSIEASFRIKPVIVLGANFYESFNAVHTVKSEKELKLALMDFFNSGYFPISIDERRAHSLKFAKGWLDFGIPTKYLTRDSFGTGQINIGKRKYILKPNLIFRLIFRVEKFLADIFLKLNKFNN